MIFYGTYSKHKLAQQQKMQEVTTSKMSHAPIFVNTLHMRNIILEISKMQYHVSDKYDNFNLSSIIYVI